MQYDPEDIDTVERFLDGKSPEIRELFRLKYEEIGVSCLTVATVDSLFDGFFEIRAKLNKLTWDVVWQSMNGIILSSRKREEYESICQDQTMMWNLKV